MLKQGPCTLIGDALMVGGFNFHMPPGRRSKAEKLQAEVYKVSRQQRLLQAASIGTSGDQLRTSLFDRARSRWMDHGWRRAKRHMPARRFFSSHGVPPGRPHPAESLQRQQQLAPGRRRRRQTIL